MDITSNSPQGPVISIPLPEHSSHCESMSEISLHSKKSSIDVSPISENLKSVALPPSKISKKGWKWHLYFGTARAQLEALRSTMSYHQEAHGSSKKQVETDPVIVRVLPQTSKEDDRRWLEFELREGKNRQVRKLCARSGLEVHVLRRVSLGPVSLGELASGAARGITQAELKACYETCYDETPSGRLPGIKVVPADTS